MIFEEKLIKSERIYEGKILNVRRDRVTAAGGEAYREIIEHSGAVAMVPIKDDGKVVMVRQYRYACGRPLLEVPAGKIDAGETDPMKTAERELREETGYKATDIQLLGKVNTSAAYSEEVIYIYGMTGLIPGDQDFDDDEAIDVVEIDFDELYDMAARGELIDVKTVAAMLMAGAQMMGR